MSENNAAEFEIADNRNHQSMATGISKKRLNYFFTSLLIISFPINYDVFIGIRFVELFFLILISINISKIRLRANVVTIVFCLFLLSGLLSYQIGILTSSILNTHNYVFILKYSFPIALWLVLRACDFDLKTSVRLMKVLYFSIVLLIFYFIVHYYSSRNGFGGFFSKRISFPLTNFTRAGLPYDSHMVSAFLAFAALCFYSVKFYAKKYNLIQPLFFMLVAILCLIASGGRAGLVALCAGVAFSIIINKRLHLGFVVFFLSSIVLVGSLFAIYSGDFEIDSSISRTFFFDFTGADDSLRARFTKFGEVLKISVFSDAPFFSRGLTALRFSWSDSIIFNVLGFSGLLGITLFFLFFTNLYWRILCTVKFDTNKAIILLVPLSTYLISNLATEFMLVTRSVVPVLLWCFLWLNIFEKSDKSLFK